jgi:putative ABC transport system ATP-binding protein
VWRRRFKEQAGQAMSNLTPSLAGHDLSKTYGRGDLVTPALRHVSLELFPGQVSLLMGPSGSGKSTLLAVLSGLLRPDGGRVVAFGADLWQLSERQRERFRRRYFGFIFQGYNLFPALTARQQLEMVLRWGHGVTGREARRKAEAMLELLGLGRKARLRPGQLSGGEKQRVAVGRALVKRPAVCFADEPTSALDWEHGEQAIRLLRAAAAEQHTTVLIVSHDARITAHVDQVLHIEDGRLGGSAGPHPAPGDPRRAQGAPQPTQGRHPEGVLP